MANLILLRHGQSKWNLENRFTGWKDIDLSDKGILEAKESGKLIKNKEIMIDCVYTSNLKRAINTAHYAMKEAGYKHLFKNDNLISISHSSINERDYGDLTGLNKNQTAEKYGKEQVQIWRRSFDVKPPGGESLSDVINRVKPYFKKIIYKEIENNNNVLMSAHGNSLRALFFVLGFNNSKDIAMLEIPTGKPFLVEFKQGKIVNKNYL